MTPEQTILQGLQEMNQPLCTLSTVTVDNKPQSASVYHVYDEKLNFYFVTRARSRKYQNILQNAHVALTVTTENPSKTIQIQGVALLSTDGEEVTANFDRLIKIATEKQAIPPVSQIPEGEMVFIKVVPDWIRMGNYEILRERDTFTEIQK